MSKCIYAGSFDPITNGHMDIINRACRLFDIVYVAIADANGKNSSSVSLRKTLATKALENTTQVKVITFDGLLSDLATNLECSVLIKGIRDHRDFDYERNLELVYKSLNPSLEVLYLITDKNNSFVSSSIVRELCSLHGDFSSYVPKIIVDDIKQIYTNNK